ncbi:MAG: glycosyltransferase [Bacteroidota bacterium]
MTNHKKSLIVSFLDKVAPKNRLQIKIIYDLGYTPVFYVNDYIGYSDQYFKTRDEHRLLVQGLLNRFGQIYSFFKKNKHNIHHVEVYPGGRFSFIYLLLARYFEIKTICVERGDLLYFKKGGYDLVTRLSMWMCYKRADMVWYREIYMEKILREMGVRKLFFLHNAVEIRNDLPEHKTHSDYKAKNIDFLWLNRLIPERMSGWFVDILARKSFESTKNILAGILPKTLYQKEQTTVITNKPTNLRLLDYVADPSALYRESKFFVLPAKVVFANNALLEAMSFGVIPIIVDSPGYELIVKDGYNGIVSSFDKKNFETAMLRALDLSEQDYTTMSNNAIAHIRSSFSADSYMDKIKKLYKEIEL